MEDFLQGEKFRNIADNNKIYYCNTHDVNHFFHNINFDYDFILISHNSDGNVTNNPLRSFDADIKNIPKNLKKWFAQNVEVDLDLIEPIPIGLENSEWFVETKKIQKLFSKNNENKQNRNLVYLNLNIKNNVNIRQPIYDMLKNKSYVTTEYGRNGMNFNHYLDQLYNHCFMVVPEGNGIDVHQPWESLYVNTIPIQKKNSNNKNWRELPICWVDDWSQMEDENFLISEYNRISQNKYDTSKLNFGFWKNKILSSL